MEFPYGNSHSRHQQHHHRRDEREDDYPPTPARPDLPPPYYAENGRFPPPPQVYHSSHVGGEGPPPPFNPNYGFPPPPSQDFNNYPHSSSYPHRPPTQDFNNYSHSSSYPTPPPPTHDLNNYVYSDSGSYPPPPQTTVQHVSHESESDYHHYRPHMPSFVHHHSHHQGSEPPNQKPAVRIFTKAKTDYSLTLRNGKVILAPSDPSDPFQHWFKDEKYSTKVKDEQGFPSFALINKATGEAIKHSIGATHPVQLAPYNPDVLDESILWTLSKDLGDGFRTIRMVNNIRLNVDAFNGDANHGGVHDGTTIVLWEWKKGDNQRWSMVPYCK